MKDSVKAWLTEQFGDDRELHDELYGQYVADMTTSAEALQALAAARDTAGLAEKGHAMKGMALQMGDQDAAASCLALQKAGQAGDFAACQQALPSVFAAVRQLSADVS